jgi:hypothetical protein
VSLAKCMHLLGTMGAQGHNGTGTKGIHSRAGDMVVVDEMGRGHGVHTVVRLASYASKRLATIARAVIKSNKLSPTR